MVDPQSGGSYRIVPGTVADGRDVVHEYESSKRPGHRISGCGCFDFTARCCAFRNDNPDHPKGRERDSQCSGRAQHRRERDRR